MAARTTTQRCGSTAGRSPSSSTSARLCLASARRAQVARLQRRFDGVVEVRRNRGAGRALLAEDPLGDPDGLLVAGALRDALQLLVRAHLEELHGVGEAGELRGRVGLRLEEGAPVERPQPQRGVLQLAGRPAERLQTLLLRGLLSARLVEVL